MARGPPAARVHTFEAFVCLHKRILLSLNKAVLRRVKFRKRGHLLIHECARDIRGFRQGADGGGLANTRGSCVMKLTPVAVTGRG